MPCTLHPTPAHPRLLSPSPFLPPALPPRLSLSPSLSRAPFLALPVPLALPLPRPIPLPFPTLHFCERLKHLFLHTHTETTLTLKQNPCSYLSAKVDAVWVRGPSAQFMPMLQGAAIFVVSLQALISKVGPLVRAMYNVRL